jgi:DNA-binding IclR family transcriptional regulator
MPATDSALPVEQRKIQSLEVGFRLIRELERASGPLQLKDVSSRAGMPRSKAHLYLATFVAIGLVARDAAGHYVLGPYALQLGLAALRQSSVVDISEETLRTLQLRTSHAVHISIWGNYGPTIVRKLDGNLNVPLSIKVGSVVPILSSASGRVFLAYLPESVTRPFIENEAPGLAYTDAPIATVIQSVRAAGVSSSQGRFYEGFSGMSAPIWDHHGELCATLTILDAAARMNVDLDGETAQLLKQSANAISARLGHTQ